MSSDKSVFRVGPRMPSKELGADTGFMLGIAPSEAFSGRKIPCARDCSLLNAPIKGTGSSSTRPKRGAERGAEDRRSRRMHPKDVRTHPLVGGSMMSDEAGVKVPKSVEAARATNDLWAVGDGRQAAWSVSPRSCGHGYEKRADAAAARKGKQRKKSKQRKKGGSPEGAGQVARPGLECVPTASKLQRRVTIGATLYIDPDITRSPATCS